MNTDVFTDINWLAVLVAGIAYWMLGALWFSKALFANRWIASHGIRIDDPNSKKNMAAIMIGSLILMLVIVIGMAIIVEKTGMAGWEMGAKLGLLTGVCFSFTAISITYLYLQKPTSAHFIDGLYHVVGQVIAGIILCSWM